MPVSFRSTVTPYRGCPRPAAVSYSTGTWTMCRVVNRRSAGQNARCVTLYASQKWSRTQIVGTTGLK